MYNRWPKGDPKGRGGQFAPKGVSFGMSSYIQKIDYVDDNSEIGTILDEALKDPEISDADYCRIYSRAMYHIQYSNIPKYYEFEADEFVEYYNQARNSQPLDVRWRIPKSDVNGKLVLADDGAGFSVYNNEIVCLCTIYGGLTRGTQLLKEAIRNGGTKITAYKGLMGFFIHNGFVPEKEIPWDDNTAPPEWIEANGFTDDTWKKESDRNFKCKRENRVIFTYTGK